MSFHLVVGQDCVCFGYDGEKVWCLPRGRRAINSMMNAVDQTRQSQTYEYSVHLVICVSILIMGLAINTDVDRSATCSQRSPS
eukprot:50105-Eustigmatos_ZCMA.PRE.1